MARCRNGAFRLTLPCLLVAAATLSGCGIEIHHLAQSPALPATPAAPFNSSAPASQIFTPCSAGSAEPFANAGLAVSELLLGKDLFRTECAHNSVIVMRSDRVIARVPRAPEPQPVLSAPADLRAPDVLITDELVGAVLTGTSEYWYQPVIGPA